MKHRISVLFALVMVLCVMTACTKTSDKKETASQKEKNNETTAATEEVTEKLEDEYESEEYNIAVLKGPTAVGFAKAWSDSEQNQTKNKYHVTAYATADEITAGIAKGEIDIAAVPCNLASVLYNKTNKQISVAAINTLSVLYMVSTQELESVADLKGKTIYTTGQGTTPEYTLNYILTENGLKVGEDVTIEYKSEAAEVAALLSQDSSAVGMLPQPYATAVITKNPSMKIVLDMGEEWNKVSNTPVVTGVVIARNNVIDRNESGFEAFLEDYSNSVEYAKSNVEDVAAILADKGIFESAIATKAIPYMNIAFITGEQMQVNVDTYLNVLYQANPKSVGGAVPDNKFYYFSEDLVG